MASSSRPNGPPPQQTDDLIATQNLLRATLDSSMNMIQVFEAIRNEHGEIIDFAWILNNRASKTIYGDVVGKSLLQQQPGVVEEGIFEAYKQVVKTGLPQQYEKQYVHEQFDGWFHQSVVKLNDGVATTTADISRQKQAEQEVLRLTDKIAQKATDIYRTLFESIDEGVAIVEVFLDEQGRVADMIWREANSGVERQAGIGGWVGKRASEMVPHLEQDWLDAMTGVYRTGEPVRMESYIADLDRWIETYYSRVGEAGSPLMAAVFQDITERKLHQRQQALLLKLSDGLRPLSDTAEIRLKAVQIVGQHLNANRVAYAENVGDGETFEVMPNYVNGLPEVVGRFPYADFGHDILSMLQAGQTRIQPDIATDEQLSATEKKALADVGVGASLNVPLVKNGTLVAFMGINYRQAHHFSAAEIELVKEVAERTWAAVERAKVEQSLRRSEAKYRTLFNSMDEGVSTLQLIFDEAEKVVDFRYLEHNPAVMRQNGITFDVVGKRQSELFPDLEPYWLEAYERVSKTDESERHQYYFVTLDNWYDIYINCVGEKGSDQVCCVYNNITDRKRHEQQQTFLSQITKDLVELNNIEDTMQLIGEKIASQFSSSWCNLVELTDGSHGAILCSGWNADSVYSVKGTYQLKDYWTEEQMLKNNNGELTVVNDAQNDPRVNAESYAALNMQSFILLPLARQGKFEFMLSIIDSKARQWREDEIDLAKELAVRIWARLEKARAEEALHESQKRFESIANLVPDLLWDSQPDGSTNWYNQRWLDYTGQRFEESIGWGWTQAIHPDDRETTTRQYDQAVETGTLLRQEYRILRHDGAYRWFVVSAAPFKDETGHVIKMYGAATDIQDLKRLEATLLEADRRKDEFLAMLAHELRNPLSTLRSGLTILGLTITDGLAPGATVASTVTMMERQTHHLVRMVDDLLDVSRISRGNIELKTERVDLVEVVSQAVKSVESLYQEQTKSLQVDLPTAPIYLEGDVTRLTQVVANLLTNGARYTAEPGQVWLSLSHQHNEAILQVRDNGIGLLEDQLSAIFELFVQVDNSTARARGGLGLGLTLVKRLVEMHGGRVVAQSEGLGTGSTFTVHLPTLTPVAPSTPEPALQATNSATAQRILVIDDNADAAFTLGMLLKLKGYEAHTRNSGRAGIEAAEALQPSVILLDIGMPELDGYATCRLIREQPWGQAMIIVALTGYGQEEDRQRTQEAGFDGHLVKPVDIAALTSLISDLLDKKKDSRSGL